MWTSDFSDFHALTIFSPPSNSFRSYLHPLKVVSVDFGSTFPLVRDARAVAGPLNSAPGASPWPQLILDLAYSGRISMKVSRSAATGFKIANLNVQSRSPYLFFCRSAQRWSCSRRG